MSTRTYNLRTRADTGVASQPRVQDDQDPHRSTTPLPRRDLPPHMSENRLVSGRATMLYSDVVASRSPSPVMRDSSVTVTRSVVVPDDNGPSNIGLRPEMPAIPTVSRENIKHVEMNTSSEEDSSPKDQIGRAHV